MLASHLRNRIAVDASAPLVDLGPETTALVQAYADDVLAGRRSRRFRDITAFLTAAAMAGRLTAKRPGPLVFQRWVTAALAMRASS